MPRAGARVPPGPKFGKAVTLRAMLWISERGGKGDLTREANAIKVHRRSDQVADKDDLKGWVVDAIRAHGGNARLIEVAKHIWQNHNEELKRSGDLFYTWQYDMRWAATVLRKSGVMKSAEMSRAGRWELNPKR